MKRIILILMILVLAGSKEAAETLKDGIDTSLPFERIWKLLPFKKPLDKLSDMYEYLYDRAALGKGYTVIKDETDGSLRFVRKVNKRMRDGTVIFQATDRSVCADALCTFTTNSAANVQLAVNASTTDGDGVIVQQNITYVGRIVLRSNPINVRASIQTGVTATGTLIPEASFPGTRVRPTSAYDPVYATIQSPGVNQPALITVEPGNTGPRCATTPCIANGWEIRRLEFLHETTLFNGGDLVSLGSPLKSMYDGGSDKQDIDTEIPKGILFEQNIVSGHPVRGQHRGLVMSCSDCTVRDNLFRHIKGVQHDGQSVLVANAGDNLDIINNKLPGGTELIMVNGGANEMRTTTTVLASPAPTTTSFAVAESPAGVLANFTGPDQWISTAVGASNGIMLLVTRVGATNVLNISPQTPIASPLAVSSTIVWTRHTRNVRILKNDAEREASQRGPIVGTPTNLTELEVAGGTLTAGAAYQFQIVSRRRSTQNNVARSTASAPITCNPTGANLSCQTTWTTDTTVTAEHFGEHYVYRTGPSGTVRFTVAAPTTTFTDTGGAGTVESVPTSAGSGYSVKNDIEMKHVRGCLIQGNYVKNIWESAQHGYPFLSSTLAGEGEDESGVISDCVWRDNWLENMAGSIALSYASTNPAYKSGTSQRISFINNIFINISHTYRIAGTIFTSNISGGNHSGLTMWDPEEFTIDHNTFYVTGNVDGFLKWSLFNGGSQRQVIGMKVTNNIGKRGTHGMKNFLAIGQSGEGTASWNAATETVGDLVSLCEDNIIQGVTVGNYPAGCAITVANDAAFTALFEDAANMDFDCAVGQACKGAASDGSDLGAHIPTILAFKAIALSGIDTIPEGGELTGPPVFGFGNSESGLGVTNISWSCTTAGLNTYIGVGCSSNSTAMVLSTVVFGTTPLGNFQSVNNTTDITRPGRVEYWFAVGPPTQTANVTVTSTGASEDIACGCVVYTNVNQIIPHGDVLTAIGDSALATNTLPVSNSNELVLDTVLIRTGLTTITVGAGQTQRVNKRAGLTGGLPTVGMSEEPGVTNTTMSWTPDDAGSKVWASIAFGLRGSDIAPTPGGRIKLRFKR